MRSFDKGKNIIIYNNNSLTEGTVMGDRCKYIILKTDTHTHTHIQLWNDNMFFDICPLYATTMNLK